jgi:predicted anti-sigma-YlaC factor YlaD
MTRNLHERAREIIVLAGVGDRNQARGRDRNEDIVDPQEQIWLQAHLQECAACRDYADAASRAVSVLRSQPLAADSGLVRTTQMRVRVRALELRRQQERFWLVSLACLFVGVSAVITTSLFWRAFEWMGVRAGVSNWVWQTGFIFFWIAPSLIVGAVIVARGTQLTGNRDRLWS